MEPRLTGSLFLAVILLSSCLPSNVSPTAIGSPFDFPWDDRSIFQSGLVQSAQGVLTSLPGASVYHISLDVADDMTHISGIEELRYTNRSPDDLSELQLRLYPNILGGSSQISLLQVEGRTVVPCYSLENSLMTVPLAAPLVPGNAVTLRVEFAVTVPTVMETNYGILVYYAKTLALAHFYPMVAVYKDGWQVGIPPKQGDILFNDTSFYIVSVTAPAGQVIVSSGREVERIQTGNHQQVLLAAGPARDFYLAASPEYVKTSETFGETTLNSYAPSAKKDGSRLALDSAKAAIQEFSAHFAPYPYTEFDVVTIPTLAYGIEYPGLTAINGDLYAITTSSDGTPMSVILESTVVHEVAHQWFYNLVGNDQVNEPWLDESLAQYVTWQYYRDRYGERTAQGFAGSLQGRWDMVDDAKIPIGLPVKDYPDNQYSAHNLRAWGVFLRRPRPADGSGDLRPFHPGLHQDFQLGGCHHCRL